MNKSIVTIAIVGGFLANVAKADPAPDFAKLFEKTKDSVVSIEVRKSQPVQNFSDDEDLFDKFFGFGENPFQPRKPSPPKKEYGIGTGSGFIIDKDGYILTNAHVVEGGDTVKVQLTNQKSYKAKVIGMDKRTDVALLKINADSLPASVLGNSDKVKVGDWVLAIGSPFGFTNTATHGIISAVGRNLPSGVYTPFIQTDAAINPGNSGGPLFNSKGEVIAINSQIYSRSGNFAGLGFSIPINLAKNISDQLKAGKKVQHGFLGISFQNIDQNLAESFKLDRPEGALISSVVAGSPADKAGLKSGDIILKYNDKSIVQGNDLPSLVALTPVGETVKIIIFREGKEKVISVKIGSLEKNSDQKQKLSNDFGLVLQNLDQQQKKSLGYREEGVLVAKVVDGSSAYYADLRVGDILAKVDGENVYNVDQAKELFEKINKRMSIPILVYRPNRGWIYLVISPRK